MSSVLVHGARRIDARGQVADAWLQARDGTITATGTGGGWRKAETSRDAAVIDAAGRYLTPGFIDLHFHGGGGFSNEDGPDALRSALAAHRAHGTTRAVASLVSNPVPVLVSALETVASLMREDPLLLGSHLEGPFLSAQKKGAHSEAHLIDPTPDDVAALLAAADGTLRHITIDPRRNGARAAARTFLSAGVVVAVGHTEAGYEETADALATGATLLTHSFNGMAGIHHRDPGPVLAAVDSGSAVLELILDGHHVHPRIAALLFALAPHRVALITDAMAAAAGPEGSYRLGDLAVEVSGGAAVVSGSTSLAGSTITLDATLRCGLAAGLDPAEVVEALTLTPARALGQEDRLGLLEPGYAADFVLFSDDWQVQSVYAAGRKLR